MKIDTAHENGRGPDTIGVCHDNLGIWPESIPALLPLIEQRKIKEG